MTKERQVVEKEGVGYILKAQTYVTVFDKLTLIDGDPATYIATSMIGTIDAKRRSSAINITGNNHANLIDGGKGADTIDGAGGADTITGGTGNDNLTGGEGNDIFVYNDGDGKDVITDYTANEDSIYLKGNVGVRSVSSKGDDVTFNVGSGSIKVTNGKGKLTKFIDKSGNTVMNQTFGDKIIKITNDFYSVVNASIDTVAITIDGSERGTAVDILGNSKNNVFVMGSDTSTVATGTGKDTIIANNNGQVLVTDFDYKKDKLKFNTAIQNVHVNYDEDLVFELGGGNVTLQGCNERKITIINENGVTISQTFGTETVTAANADGSIIAAYGATEVLDAGSRTKAVMLVGNELDNTLIGGKNGKKTYDTLTGGAGDDVFFHKKSGGYDLITDYTYGDTIKLDSKVAVRSAKVEGTDYVFTLTDGGQIKVQNGASKDIVFENSKNVKFSYNAPSSQLNNVWFDDNSTYGMIDTNLDSILNNDYSLTNEHNFTEEVELFKENKIELTSNKKGVND